MITSPRVTALNSLSNTILTVADTHTYSPPLEYHNLIDQTLISIILIMIDYLFLGFSKARREAPTFLVLCWIIVLSISTQKNELGVAYAVRDVNHMRLSHVGT